MVNRRRDFSSHKRIKFFVFVVIILLIVSVGFFVLKYFLANPKNIYLIKSKYYGFELSAPKNWLAEKNMLYSDDNIAQIISDCKSDKLGGQITYKIGDFRIKDNKSLQSLGDAGYSLNNENTGAIFNIAVNCIPDYIKDVAAGYGIGNFKIDGAGAFEEFLNLPDFGKTKNLFFVANNLQYKISEYIYVSPTDKKNEDTIRNNYAKVFDQIASSFKFIK